MRRPVGENDIKIQIAYCGICHSDLHQIHNDWKNSSYPMVPGCAPCVVAGANLHCKGFCLRFYPVIYSRVLIALCPGDMGMTWQWTTSGLPHDLQACARWVACMNRTRISLGGEVAGSEGRHIRLGRQFIVGTVTTVG